VNCDGSKRTGRPYSSSIRLASTSNCSAPTTPTMKPEPMVGLKTLAAPFLGELHQRLVEVLGLHRIARAAGLQKLRREGRDAGEAQRLALGQRVADASWPWLGMPMMSPAQASSASSRSEARNSTGFEIAIGFFERTWVSFMPR
jgi:hypothetical protein